MTTTTIHLPGDQPTPTTCGNANCTETTRRFTLEAGDERAAEILRRELARIRREHPQQPEPVAGFSSSI